MQEPQEQTVLSQTTEQHLRRQAELLRSKEPARQQAGSKVRHSLPVYKSSKQIKQENYDLRHTKRFTRALQMHSVMPKMLRRATEPPKIKIASHEIDVEARVRNIVKEFADSEDP